MYFITGDWRFFWPENIIDFVHFPSAWDSILNTGIGGSATGTLWITSYLNFTALFSRLGLSWNLIEFLFWFLPAIILSFVGAKYLFKTIFPSKKKWGLLAGFIYLINTYFLMIFTGGQMGVCLAYSLAPFVIARFIINLKSTNAKNAVLFGLLLSIQILFDPRLVYITFFSIALYSLFNINRSFFTIRNIILIFIIPFIITLLLHSYWIIPLLLIKTSVSGFNTYIGGLDFFSFAKLENTISLLHPNWPENIFGKVYFMRPEFLLIPILAYSSILFVNNKNMQAKINVLIFSLFGIFGSFMSKGTSEPVGNIYLFLYNNIPGFFLFRDPTKWYILIAVSYCILIPFSISNIYKKIELIQESLLENFPKISQVIKFAKKNKLLNPQNIFLIFIIMYLIFLVSPYFFSKSLVRPRTVPNDYILLKNLLVSDRQFSRTYWIPQWQRFGYFSLNHPAIGREELLDSVEIKSITKILGKPENQNLLKLMAVKYIIVPFDSEGEIFLTDRKYDKRLYTNLVANLDKISWLKRIKGFDRIAVYEISSPYNHFWIPGKQSASKSVNFQQLNESSYELKLSNVKKNDLLVFSETYNEYWFAKIGDTNIKSFPYEKKINSFFLPKSGNYEIEVYYYPQQLVNFGLFISVISLLICVSFVIRYKKR